MNVAEAPDRLAKSRTAESEAGTVIGVQVGRPLPLPPVPVEPPVPVAPAVPLPLPAVPVVPAVPPFASLPPQPAAETAATATNTSETRPIAASVLTNMRILQDILEVFPGRAGFDTLPAKRLL